MNRASLLCALGLSACQAATTPLETVNRFSSAAAGGAPNGTSLVDPRMGELHYAFPLQVPPGRDGVTPRLALDYSSGRALDSDIGRGFVVLGVSSIERDSRSGAPRYDATERFVLRVGDSRQTLVKVGSHELGIEYRLFDESDEMQFLFSGAENKWTVRTRNGRVSTYTQSIVQDSPSSPAYNNRDHSRTFSWALAKERDRNGNTIEYQYATFNKPTLSEAKEQPRLMSVVWGGNDGSTGAPRIPHLFAVHVLRRSWPTPPGYETLAPPARDADCNYTVLGTNADFRSGGLLLDGSEEATIWGFAIETTAPGTTDGSVRERATRLNRFYRLSYNWDEGGCQNTDELHQQLRFIEEHTVDEAGQWTSAPTTSFEYNGFDRRFVKTGEYELPAVRAYPERGAQLTHGLTRGLSSLVNPGQELAYSDDQHFAAGAVLSLFDADFDGRLDLLDTQSRTQGEPGHARVAPTLSLAHQPARLAAVTPVGSFEPWFTNLNYNEMLIDDWSVDGYFDADLPIDTMPLGLAVGHSLSFEGGPELQSDNALWLDMDADGYVDYLRWHGKETPRSHLPIPGARGFGWSWYRNSSGPSGVTFEAPRRLAALPWDSAQPYAWSAHRPSYGFARWNLQATRSLKRTGTYGNLVAGTYPTHSVALQDQTLGALLDLTGDGLIDRVVNTARGAHGGALTVYPGTAPGVFGAPRDYWLPTNAEQASLPLTLQRTLFLNAIEDRGAQTGYVSDVAVDLNGDGWLDVLSQHPVLEAFSQDSWAEWSSVARLQLARPVTYFNSGSGLVMDDFVPSAMREHSPTTLGVVQLTSDTTGSRSHQARVSVLDFNGDRLPDLVGAADGWIQFNRGGRFMAPVQFGPMGLDVTFNEESVGDRGTMVGKRILADINNDGRPDVLSMIANSNRYAVYTDADLQSPPGTLRAIVHGGARTEISYQPRSAMRQPGERGVPSSGFVVERLVEQLDANTTHTTAFAYEGAVLARDPATKPDGSPVFWRSGFAGYQHATICHPNGTQTESRFSYTGVRRGVLVEQRVIGADRSVPPGSSKCRFYVRSPELGGPDRTRQITEYTYLEQERFNTGEKLITRRPSRVRVTNIDPQNQLQQVRETSYTYATVADRLVPHTVTDNPVPSTASSQSIVTLAHAANPSGIARAYDVLEVSREVRDGAGRLLARTENYFDGSRTLGEFTRGNRSMQRQHVTESLIAETSYGLDALGHIIRTASPQGRQTTYCWDRNGLYPVLWQDAARLTRGQVVDYATGNVLENSGPVGLSTEPLACPTLGPSANFTPRRALVALPRLDLIKRFSYSPRVTPPSYAPRGGESLEAGDFDSHSRTPFGLGAFEAAPTSAEPTRPITVAGVKTIAVPLETGPLSASPAVAAPTSSVYATRRYYDGRGRVLRVIEPHRFANGVFELGDRATYSYTATLGGELTTSVRAMRPESMRDAPSERSMRDDWGRLVFEEYAVDYSAGLPTRYATQTFEFRPSGEVLATVGPSANGRAGATSRSTVVEYDDLGRPTVFEDAAGGRSQRDEQMLPTADGVMRVVTHTDAAGHTVQQELNALGQVVIRRRGPLETHYRYDALGRQVRQQDPNGAVLRSFYDLRGRLVGQERFGSELAEQLQQPHWSYLSEYDLDGQLTRRVEQASDGTAETTAYGYDDAGRLVRVTPPAAPDLQNYGETTYKYERRSNNLGLGRLRSVTGPTENIEYTYDARGRVARMERSVHARIAEASLVDSYAVLYEYNFQDLPIRTTYVPDLNDPSQNESTRMEYLPNGRLRQLVDEVSGRVIASYTTNDAGLVDRVETLLGTVETFERDPLGHVERHQVTHKTATWSQYTSFLPNGLPTSTTTHDSIGRGPIDERQVAYDEASRIKSIERALTEGPGTARESATMRYEQDRIKAVIEAGASGARHYAYSYEGVDPSQLTLLSRNEQPVQRFSYNSMGHEIEANSSVRGVNPMGQTYRSETNSYLHGTDGRISHIYDGKTGRLLGNAGDWRFIYRKQGDVFVRETITRLAGIVEIALGTGTAQVVHRDLQGSPAWVLDQATGGFARVSYSEFGLPRLAQQNLPFDGFQGGWKDPNTDRVWFGVRSYDPLTLRWNAPDPIRTNDPYQFNLDNPMMLRDPEGTQPEAIDAADFAAAQRLITMHPELISPDAPHEEIAFRDELVHGNRPNAPGTQPAAPLDESTLEYPTVWHRSSHRSALQQPTNPFLNQYPETPGDARTPAGNGRSPLATISDATIGFLRADTMDRNFLLDLPLELGLAAGRNNQYIAAPYSSALNGSGTFAHTNVLVVDSHGEREGPLFHFIDNGPRRRPERQTTPSPRQFVRAMRRIGFAGNTVIVAACQVGTGTWPQQVADLLGPNSRVYGAAPTYDTPYDTDAGNATWQGVNGGSYREFIGRSTFEMFGIQPGDPAATGGNSSPFPSFTPDPRFTINTP